MNKILLFGAIIAVLCMTKLIQTQFADVDKNDPQQMYEITMTKNGVAK